MYIQVMLILILVDIQYSQNVIFSFEKVLNGPNHSLSDSHPPNKKILQQQNFPFFRLTKGRFPPSLLMLFGKACQMWLNHPLSQRKKPTKSAAREEIDGRGGRVRQNLKEGCG